MKPAVIGEAHKIRRENTIGLSLIAPAVLLIVFVSIIPIIQTFLYSLQYYNLTDPTNQKYIGFENYRYLFTLPDFYDNLKNTMIFAVSSVLAELIIGLTGALLMNGARRGVGLIRTTVLIPWAIPGIVVAQIFRFLFDGQLGLINAVMRNMGFLESTQSFAFLAKPGWAMFAVVVADAWKQFPFVALMLLAGLQMIPQELYESADVDGANAFRKFFAITLPMIKPMILVTLLFRTMAAIRIFDIVFAMTGGGPANSTSTLLYTAYIYLFKDMNFGRGSAMSTVIFAIIFILSMFYISMFKNKDDDD